MIHDEEEPINKKAENYTIVELNYSLCIGNDFILYDSFFCDGSCFVKEYLTVSSDNENFQREYSIFTECHSKYIPRSLMPPIVENGKLYLVFERTSDNISCISLQSLIQNCSCLSSQEASNIISQIFDVIRLLDRFNIHFTKFSLDDIAYNQTGQYILIFNFLNTIESNDPEIKTKELRSLAEFIKKIIPWVEDNCLFLTSNEKAIIDLYHSLIENPEKVLEEEMDLKLQRYESLSDILDQLSVDALS